ncbi:MAG: acetyl-CoA carboxylase biotin carboxyl carrier protein subunit [Microscillaceae bacterium]|jgi:biotin carboxyl carrier protein|nr:acetyl-CoA carboxylase biotin carboxyl carrier protein subunit [Microscillaceae bacterium]
MFKIKTNPIGNPAEAQNYELEKNKTEILLNKQPFAWDLIQVKDHIFHIIRDNQSYLAEVIKADYEAKTFTIKLNHKLYEVELHDKFDQLLQKMGMDKTATNKVSEVKAPMPGLIIDVKVEEGQTVKKGDALLILEAMKMENVLKSPTDGVIKAIKVKKGDNVEKNHILVQFS